MSTAKAVSFIVLLCDSYDEEAKKELEGIINLYVKRLKRWKLERVSTLEI